MMSVSRRAAYELAGVAVPAGAKATVHLDMPRLYTRHEAPMPVHVIHGKRYGPTLFVCAALHGDEVLGVEIIRRLLALKRLNFIQGTLLAVPVVNVLGFVSMNRYLPDRRDLNRVFPGSEKGSVAARVAKVFLDEVVARADWGIDLHTASNHRENLPQVRAHTADPEVLRLAQAFGAPVILDAGYREGSLRKAADALGTKVIVYEGGEALRFDESAVRAGLWGVLSCMGELGMLANKHLPRRRTASVVSTKSSWVRAPISGIFRRTVRLGAWVKKNQLLGYVSDPSDPFGENSTVLGGMADAPVRAQAAGVVIGALNLPMAHQGDALFHVAVVGDQDEASEALEVYAQEVEDPEGPVL